MTLTSFPDGKPLPSTTAICNNPDSAPPPVFVLVMLGSRPCPEDPRDCVVSTRLFEALWTRSALIGVSFNASPTANGSLCDFHIPWRDIPNYFAILECLLPSKSTFHETNAARSNSDAQADARSDTFANTLHTFTDCLDRCSSHSSHNTTSSTAKRVCCATAGASDVARFEE